MIFMDLDGTLEDSRQDMAEAVVRVRRHFGLPEGEVKDHRKHVHRGMAELYRACFADLLARTEDPAAALSQVRLAYEADYLAHVAVHTRPYPGIPEALHSLAVMGRIVLITNKPERISWALLSQLGLAGSIADVIGGDTCAEGKPSPAPLHLALGRQPDLPMSPAGSVMIGDSVADIRAGRAFGAATIWCAWGYASSPAPEVPDFTCDRAGDLPALVAAALR